MVKKKIDNRIRVMIENGVKLRHRTMFLLVGDKSRDQVPILYDMLVKSTVKARPTVLWCYKNKDEAISNHGRKRAKKIAAGKLEVSEESLFDSFRVATTIHGRYYSETHAILGHTYGVCVLQDFEALTPNLMARTIETVEGGGLIIFLLKSMDSLRQLHSMTMDVHSRFKTEAYGSVANRFNERFLLSLTDHPRCLVLDDALTVLPISSKTTHVEPVSSAPETVNPQLSSLVDSLSDSPPAGPLVALCRTYDQATALATIIDTLADKQARPPHCLTAARGRGKSACLGLGVAAAVALGYVNVYVTSPHPENMATLFQFALRGLDALLYQEHTDYNIVRSTNPEFRKAIVRIDIARNSRQTIQYITPDDHSLLGAADLVLVDEAAAIPLGLVREAVRRAPLALLASTVAGYEGTGRALALKLFTQLQTKHNAPPPLKLEEPIRYGAGDGVEAWLNGLLCLEATVGASAGGAPPPASCSLYRVDRDALFCYHRAADAFLHRLVAVLVASHYKNSPNDLQLMADAPAHNLFVLLAPSPPHSTALPDILCVVQLCMEGNISDKSVRESVGRGRKAAGDLVPWNVCEQYGDAAFPQLCGARIVRIATHPSYQRMGYGKRALQQLIAYYSGEMASLEETEVQDGVSEECVESAVEGGGLREERIVPRARPPPLLRRLHEMAPEELHYIGTSFGLTEELIKFWKSQKFVPIYLSQKSNDITGEHSCILIRCLSSDNTWLPAYHADFRVRLSRLLPRALRSLPATLALATLNNQHVKLELAELTRSVVDTHLTGHDVARLERYCRQQVEHSLVADLFSTLAHLYFHTRHNIKLDAVQQVILVAMGFQVKEVEAISQELGLPAAQVLARLYDGCRRVLAALLAVLERDAAAALGLNESKPMSTSIDTVPALQSLPEEMDAAAKELERKQRKELSRLMGEDLQQYRIKGSETDWSQAVAHSKHSNLISVKSGEKRLGDDTKELDNLINANPKKKLKKKHNRHK